MGFVSVPDHCLSFYFGWEKDVFICSAQIPQVESSCFADHFDQLDQEISRFSLTGEVIIMGDTNG